MICAFGPIGFVVEEPQVVVHEGHPPERVGDLADSDLYAWLVPRLHRVPTGSRRWSPGCSCKRSLDRITRDLIRSATEDSSQHSKGCSRSAATLG